MVVKNANVPFQKTIIFVPKTAFIINDQRNYQNINKLTINSLFEINKEYCFKIGLCYVRVIFCCKVNNTIMTKAVCHQQECNRWYKKAANNKKMVTLS